MHNTRDDVIHWQIFAKKQSISMILFSIQNKGQSSAFLSMFLIFGNFIRLHFFIRNFFFSCNTLFAY